MLVHAIHTIFGWWATVRERTVHTATELTDTTPEQHTAYIRTKLEIITCTSQKKRRQMVRWNAGIVPASLEGNCAIAHCLLSK